MALHKQHYTIHNDKSKLDLNRVHHFLKESYWAKNIPFDIFKKSVDHSLCFGVYAGKDQIGFARVISDYTTFAYIGDVYIEPPYRGIRLSKLLMDAIMNHPDLQGLRRWMLATKDAHGPYKKFGFSGIKNPQMIMEKIVPGIYL